MYAQWAINLHYGIRQFPKWPTFVPKVMVATYPLPFQAHSWAQFQSAHPEEMGIEDSMYYTFVWVASEYKW